MRFALRLFGAEVLAVEVDTAASDDGDAAEPEMGPPFGFSGGAGGVFDPAPGLTEFDD